MNDTISQFTDAIRASGLEPPEAIEPGKFHRFPGMGKSRSNTAGWCVFFSDGQGGCFGDWSTGFSENWQARRDGPLSDFEQAAFTRRCEQARQAVEDNRQQHYTDAAERAEKIWHTAAPAENDHPYLIRKGIKAHGARLYKNILVIPVRSGGQFSSLQFINADGGKKFLKGGQVAGGCFVIGAINGAKTLCITEGFATGATIYQATGYPVAVAFNAGNLQPVAMALRQQWPDLSIIICADDDIKTAGNPGVTQAHAAALSIDAKVALPVFGNPHPPGATDFNDMAAQVGLEAVAKAIAAAKKPEAKAVERWPEPLPLIAKIEPEDYPLDALPDGLRAAVEEAHAFIQAPVPLVASSALAALSLAAQAHADVKRAEKLSGPIGLFLLTIADSGERKSTCDKLFMKAIYNYEAEQAEAAKPLLKEYQAAMQIWEAKHNGIKEKIRQLAKTGKPTGEQESALLDLQDNKPEAPRVPRLVYVDATPEALKWSLAKDWPSGGIVSSEAGLVFGAHGMGKDSIMRNLSTLNQLWDGSAIVTDRRSSESFTVRGVRLTVALQVQEATLRSFFDRSDSLARGTGFLARCLVAWPQSTQGTRMFSDAPESWPELERFHRRITEILQQPVSMDSDGTLEPSALPLAKTAKAAWVTFHDAIERELRSGGELYDVRDVASKTADNAVRIATLFHLFERDAGSAISLKAFEGASRIAAWHLHEARCFYSELALPEAQANAARLDSWLLDYCRRENTPVISRREVQRNVSPVRLRQKDPLDKALAELMESGRIRLLQQGRRKEIAINPALLTEKLANELEESPQ